MAGIQAPMVRGDMALAAPDAEAQVVVGSFTVDGLTYAIDGEGRAALVAAAPLGGAELTLPAAVAYGSAEYALVCIAPLALSGCGAVALSVPASVEAVDPAAALGCETLAEVSVDTANPFFTAFDGYLADKALTSVLLVPEGRTGQLRIPSTIQTLDPRAFSHCARIDALAVDADCPGLASWNGSVYTKDLAELVRVPAGATELTLPAECTAIGPGALSGCTELRSIQALGAVDSIAPSAFGEIEEVETLPVDALAAVEEDSADERPAQVTGLVAVASSALSSVQVDKSAIEVTVPAGSDASAWEAAGFAVLESGAASEGHGTGPAQASTQFSSVYSVFSLSIYANYPITLNYWPKKTPDDDNGPRFERAASWSSPSVVSNATMWRPQGGYGYIQIFYGGTTVTWYNTYIRAEGYRIDGHYTGSAMLPSQKAAIASSNTTSAVYIKLTPIAYSISYDLGEGATQTENPDSYTIEDTFTLKEPTRPGYLFLGWSGTGIDGISKEVAVSRGTGNRSYEAHWQLADFNLGFDVDSEPGDENYPAEVKPDQTVNIDSGKVEIENPKRPGYVFEGWVIPSSDGTEAVDQELVYEGEDGKWYVDASKLPDYAGDDGRVELTARWTSIISVDVPQSVTFYADTVTQGQESREGSASSAFGQSKAVNQSQVDLRVVGLESEAVKTTDTTLGADSVLKKATAATPSTSAGKLLSLYPSTKQWTADELQDPNAVGGTKAANAVDFDLDDILLEASFPSDAFTITAGDTLNMGYRLNLAETGQQLDYGKLSTLEDGQSAAIANVSYCFAADALPSDWGEPLWIENPDRSLNPAKYLLLSDIKAAADDLSAHGDDPTQSGYYPLYSSMVGSGTFHLEVDGRYLDVELLGICQDTKTAGGKAGLTFQTRDIYAYNNGTNEAAGSKPFDCWMNAGPSNADGWKGSALRERLRTTFFADLDVRMQSAIAPVNKFQQLGLEDADPTTGTKLQATADETIWLPSMYEVFGKTVKGFNGLEGASDVAGYAPFQYEAFRSKADGGVLPMVSKEFNDEVVYWWLRSSYESTPRSFCNVNREEIGYGAVPAQNANGVAPAFCL